MTELTEIMRSSNCKGALLPSSHCSLDTSHILLGNKARFRRYISLHCRNLPDTLAADTEAAPYGGRGMKKLVVAGIALGTIVIAAVLWARMEKARGQENLRSVDVVPVTRRDIGTAVKATGVIKPMVGAQVNVGSSASGVVMHLYVRIGDRGSDGATSRSAGQLRELTAKRDADVAAVQLAKANLDYAQTDLRRKQELHAAQIIAPSVLDVASQANAVAEQRSTSRRRRTCRMQPRNSATRRSLRPSRGSSPQSQRKRAKRLRQASPHQIS